ncbi:MAG TPA: amino acid ABC transporter substrate-binding protein [Ktedonobacteraceae bacterium]|jgi:branched-chain amino acid transport system substrate-binding protein|nr:amino acid ABC transporter substrate-binding protein [Ktedonobacteraceae bacterium]
MMKQTRLFQLIMVGLGLMMLTLLPACGGGASSGSSSNAPKQIVIGASIPETGALAAFGSYAKWGYSAAVADVNKSGGLFLSKYNVKVPVKLILYDDQSQPDQVTANTQRLVLSDKVNALLGSATPPLVIPGAVVAERNHIPLVAGMTPIRAFLGANPHWTYAWDIFFDEFDMTQQQFLTMNTVQSNHKVALFTDNEQDGVVMGQLWTQNAPKFGYQIAYHASFPVGTTDYGDLIRRAQASGAQIVIAQMETPDAITLWRQMQTLNYRPAAAFIEKGAEPVQWWNALKMAAQGTMVAGYWYPTLPYPGASTLRQRFEKDTGQTYSQHIADTYTAAQVLMDAIVKAGSLDAQAINTAIGQTNKTYVVGPVDFAKGPAGHTSPLPSFMLQWQDGQTQIVYPQNKATARFIYPLPPWSAV